MFSVWKYFGNQREYPENISGQRLILPDCLEDGRVPKSSASFSYIACGLLLLAILWGSIATIEEIAIANGQVIPSGSIKQVQHLEGGIVEKIYIEEGQLVEKGDLLVELRPASAQSDLDQLSVRSTHMQLKKERLYALSANKKPDFTRWESEHSKLVANERTLYNSSKTQMEQELSILASKIAQRKSELFSSTLEAESIDKQSKIAMEKLAIRSKLMDQGYASKRSYLETKAEYELYQSKIITARGKIATLQEQLKQDQDIYDEAQAKAYKKIQEEYTTVLGELAELEQSIMKYNDRVVRLKVRAPVRGIVQHVSPKSSEEVLKPGEVVASIVPIDEKVVAEVEIDPKDIGYMQVGHHADIRISTYDPNVFGTIAGQIMRLSASTYQKENGSTYYKAIIQLDKNHLGPDKSKHLIVPGMVVRADIATGAKSLTRYMLKPVYNSLNNSFIER